MNRGVLATVVAVLLVASAAGGYAFYKFRLASPGTAGGPQGDAPAYEPEEAAQIVEVAQVMWQPTADLVGTVVAKRSVMVRNELAGVVRHVGFESGAVVEPGQVMLRQDDALERADLEAAQANVRVAEANVVQAASQVRLAQMELERVTRAGVQSVAEMEIDRTRSRLDTAQAERSRWEAEVDQARARVAQVDARLAKLTMFAPFRARVGMRMVQEGQYLAEGVDVVMMQELADKIYLDFAVPQEQSARVAIGTRVMANAKLLGPDPVRIEVVAIDAAVNNETRNLRVRAVVDNPKGTLLPGMFIEVRVPIEAPTPQTVVPGLAIRRAAYANSVFVLVNDEQTGATRAKQRFVKLGSTIGENVIVLEGLKPGEKVAGAGSFKLRDGVKVMIAPPGGPAAPGIAHQQPAPTDGK